MQYFVVFEALLAVFIIIALLSYVHSVAAGSLFEQNFLARDVGLTIDSLYASPGEINMIYDSDIKENAVFDIPILTFAPETKLRFAFEKSRVHVFRDSSGELYQNPATYAFGEDYRIKFNTPQEGDANKLNRNAQGYEIPNTKSNLLIKNSNGILSVEFTELNKNGVNNG